MNILIRNGRVIDGTGRPAYPADVMISDDRIEAVGRMENARADRIIEADGKVVCPGFIDCHSHSDWSILANPEMQSTIRQGVTTEIVGNCGMGMAPVSDFSRDHVREVLKGFTYSGEVTWSDFSEYLDTVARMKTSANLAFFAGHNAIRSAAGIYASGKRPTKAQIDRMEEYMREAMDAGAMGLSTGLEYEPGRSADRDEILALARIASDRGGMYASHIRNYDEHLLPAVDEFLTIARESGARGQLSHLNVRENTGAPDNAWHLAVDALQQARQNGLAVQTDCVGYVDGIGLLASLLPSHVMDGGPETAAMRLKDPYVRKQLRTECDRYWRFLHRGEWDRVRILQKDPFPEIVGKNFMEIADLWHKDPWDCYFDILAAAGSRMSDVIGVGVLFTDAHVADMVSHPLFCLEADTFTSDIDSPLRDKMPYKSSFGGMLHFITRHVREQRTLSPEEAIRKMTGMPAAHFGLRERGLLEKGYYADVVVFDYEDLTDGIAEAGRLAYAGGVAQVLVNGCIVVDDSMHTGRRPGRVLTRR